MFVLNKTLRTRMFKIYDFLQVRDLNLHDRTKLVSILTLWVSRNIILSVSHILVTSVMCKKYLSTRLIVHWKNKTYLYYFYFLKIALSFFSLILHIHFSHFFCSLSIYVPLFVTFHKWNSRWCRIFIYRRIFNQMIHKLSSKYQNSKITI